MPYFDIIWEEGGGGNVEHIARHNLTPDDVEYVLENPVSEDVSVSSERPVAFGYIPDGRYICVVFEEFDESTLYPITAFEVEEP